MKLSDIDGFSPHRLHPNSGNPREVAFASAWKAINTPPNPATTPTLANLVPDLSERDAKVAATVIQWLGSPVGTSFLRQVVDSSPDVRATLTR